MGRPLRLPYLDQILGARAHSPDPSASPLLLALGTRHVHWGYYRDPETADASLEGLAAAQEALSERLFCLAGVGNGQHILEVGCGLGGTLALLDERHTDLTLHGLNIDPRQLREARRVLTPRPGNRVCLMVADACNCPIATAFSTWCWPSSASSISRVASSFSGRLGEYWRRAGGWPYRISSRRH